MEYKYKWYIPDAYLHSRGTGYFTSHEGCAFINETDRDAHVRFTFYFQDREPMTGYTSVVPARRTKHARFDLMENDKGEPVPMNVGYAVVVESDMDMPVQFSHCDTSQPELQRLFQIGHGKPVRPQRFKFLGHAHSPMAIGVRLDHTAHLSVFVRRPAHRVKIMSQSVKIDLRPGPT